MWGRTIEAPAYGTSLPGVMMNGKNRAGFLDLVLEASLPVIQVGLFGDDVRMVRRLEGGRGEALDGLVDDLLQEAGVCADDVNRVLVFTGPGSFTGLRVGIAWAEGFCMGTSRLLAGVTTLAALASQVIGSAAVLLQARPGWWYFGRKPAGAPDALYCLDEECCVAEDALPGLCTGLDKLVIWKSMPAALQEDSRLVDLASTGLDLERLRIFLDYDGAAHPPVPNYLQDTYAQPPGNAGKPSHG